MEKEIDYEKERKKKYSVKKQVFGMLNSHLLCNFILLFFGIFVLAAVEKYMAVKIILSILIAFIYSFSIFSSSYGMAEMDHKSYSPLTPYPLKGLLLSSGIVIFNIVLLVYYLLCWKYKPIEDSFVLPTFISGILFVFSTSGFSGFLNIQGGSVNMLAVVFAEILPIIACTFGYFCGYKKWDYTKYMGFLVYEKKKKRK